MGWDLDLGWMLGALKESAPEEIVANLFRCRASERSWEAVFRPISASRDKVVTRQGCEWPTGTCQCSSASIGQTDAIQNETSGSPPSNVPCF